MLRPAEEPIRFICVHVHVVNKIVNVVTASVRAGIFRVGGGVKFSWMIGFVVIRGKQSWSGQV